MKKGTSKRTAILMAASVALGLAAVPVSPAVETQAAAAASDLGKLHRVYACDFNSADAGQIQAVSKPEGDAFPVKDDSITLRYEDSMEGHGKALYLDGSSAYGVELPVGNPGNSYTISFWIKMEEPIASYTPVLFSASETSPTTDVASKWLSVTKLEGIYGTPIIWSRNAEQNTWPFYDSDGLDILSKWEDNENFEEKKRSGIISR